MTTAWHLELEGDQRKCEIRPVPWDDPKRYELVVRSSTGRPTLLENFMTEEAALARASKVELMLRRSGWRPFRE